MRGTPPSPSDNAAFRLTPDLRFLFAYDGHEDAFAKLHGGIEAGKRLSLVTGSSGVGKTLLLRRLEAALAQAGIASTYTALPDLELASLLGDDVRQSPASRHVILIDDADRSSRGFLQRLDEHFSSSLSGARVLQFVLAGGIGFGDDLAASFPALHRRIETHAGIEPLNSAQSAEYIRHRLSVSGSTGIQVEHEAMEVISGSAGGIPRLINHICARAVLLAGMSQRQISREIANEAIEDYQANISFGGTSNASLFRPPQPVDAAQPSPTSATRPLTADAPPDRSRIEPAKATDVDPERAPPAVPIEDPAPPSASTEAPDVTAAERDAAAEIQPTAPPGVDAATDGHPDVPAPTAADVDIPPRPTREALRRSEGGREGRRSVRPNQLLRSVRYAADDSRHRDAAAAAPKFSGFRERRLTPRTPAVRHAAAQGVGLPAPPRRSGSMIFWLAILLSTAIAAALILMQQPQLKDLAAERGAVLIASLTDAWNAISGEFAVILERLRALVDRLTA
jgi:type II secretory pathway predicted ATPase ExeA